VSDWALILLLSTSFGGFFSAIPMLVILVTAMNESSTWKITTQRFNDAGLVGTDNISCSRSRTGTTQPGWKRLIRTGGDASTSFTASLNHYHPDYSFLIEGARQINNDYTGTPVGGPVVNAMTGPWMRFSSISNPTTQSDVEADNQALKLFVQKANSVQRSLQGGVAIGELTETLRMIRNPAKALRRGLDTYLDLAKKRAIRASRNTNLTPKAAKQGNAARHKAVKAALSDTWLENAFGWQPLISDIRDGAKALARLNYYEYPPIESVSARGRSGSIIESSGSTATRGQVRFTSGERTTLTVEVQYKGGVKSVAPHARPYAEFGFTPSAFVPTVWELIPFSFVADYFTNIGDILEGWSFQTASFAWKCKTVRKMARKESIDPMGFHDTGDANDTGLYFYFRPGKPSWVRKNIARDRHTGHLVPDFQFEIPGFGTKWINLAALSSRSRSISRRIRGL